MGAIKITPADSAFSKCVRQRAGFKCERCGSQHDTSSTGLHCSHYYGRGNWSVRFEPLNAYAHCMGCHLHLSARPAEFTWWICEKIGGANHDLLIELSRDISRGREYRKTKGKGDIAKHYRQEYARMQETGSREFVGYF